MKQGKKVSYHVFPRDVERREQWLQAVKRQNIDGSKSLNHSKWLKWEPSKHAHAVLCGEHFITG